MTKISIKGDKWKVFVFEGDEYVNKFGDSTAGFTDIKRRQIFFNAEDLDLELVRHEIFHAYKSYQYLDAATVDDANIEEIYAEMFAKDGPRMLSQSDELFKKLRSLE